jgi:hypothetical protein
MIRSIVLSSALLLGLASAASAAVVAAPPAQPGTLVIKVAQGCGPGFWRGPGGHCHPYARHRACPRGYHLGSHGKRCWPN